MDETITLLEQAIAELQLAETTRAKKALSHIRRALTAVNEAHHNLTT